MSSSPTNQIERNRGTADRQSPVCARRMMSAKLRANCPYTPRDLAGHYDPNGQLHACAKCDGRHGPSTDYYPHKSHRRQLCATVPIITGTAKASAARFVTDDLVSSVTTSAEPPSAQGNAPIASRSVGMRTADGCAGLKRPDDWDALHPAIERNRDNPDGRSHLCAPPPRAYRPSDTVYCFALGGAT